MNKVIEIGRLTADPEVRYSQGENATAVAKFTLAVDRKKKDSGADFIRCIAFGKDAEFIEKYFHKGSKMVLEGRIQTGSYTGKDGTKVYTTDVVVEKLEFGESKSESKPSAPAYSNGFMDLAGIEVDELPFD